MAKTLLQIIDSMRFRDSKVLDVFLTAVYDDGGNVIEENYKHDFSAYPEDVKACAVFGKYAGSRIIDNGDGTKTQKDYYFPTKEANR